MTQAGGSLEPMCYLERSNVSSTQICAISSGKFATTFYISLAVLYHLPIPFGSEFLSYFCCPLRIICVLQGQVGIMYFSLQLNLKICKLV